MFTIISKCIPDIWGYSTNMYVFKIFHVSNSKFLSYITQCHAFSNATNVR